MKRVNKNLLAPGLILLVLLISCSQAKMDRNIKADITAKAKSEIAFAGVNYTLNEGIAQLSVTCPVTCPSLKEKDKVKSTVRKIAGVKNVVNTVTIAPVILDEDFSLKQSVDSVLKSYTKATAQVHNKQVVLIGTIKAKEQQQVTEALQKLGVAGIDNRLTVE